MWFGWRWSAIWPSFEEKTAHHSPDSARIWDYSTNSTAPESGLSSSHDTAHHHCCGRFWLRFTGLFFTYLIASNCQLPFAPAPLSASPDVCPLALFLLYIHVRYAFAMRSHRNLHHFSQFKTPQTLQKERTFSSSVHAFNVQSRLVRRFIKFELILIMLVHKQPKPTNGSSPAVALNCIECR